MLQMGKSKPFSFRFENELTAFIENMAESAVTTIPKIVEASLALMMEDEALALRVRDYAFQHSGEPRGWHCRSCGDYRPHLHSAIITSKGPFAKCPACGVDRKVQMLNEPERESEVEEPMEELG